MQDIGDHWDYLFSSLTGRLKTMESAVHDAAHADETNDFMAERERHVPEDTFEQLEHEEAAQRRQEEDGQVLAEAVAGM